MLTALLVSAMLTWGSPWVPPPGVRCQSYEEPTLRRWQTICADGTRGVSTWNPTLRRWETVVTPPPGRPWRTRRWK